MRWRTTSGDISMAARCWRALTRGPIELPLVAPTQARGLGKRRGGSRAHRRHAVLRAPGTTRPFRTGTRRTGRAIHRVNSHRYPVCRIIDRGRAVETGPRPDRRTSLPTIRSRRFDCSSLSAAASSGSPNTTPPTKRWRRLWSISRNHPDAEQLVSPAGAPAATDAAPLPRQAHPATRGTPELRAEMDRDGNWPPADRVKLLIEAAYAANLDARDAQAAVDIRQRPISHFGSWARVTSSRSRPRAPAAQPCGEPTDTTSR